MKVRFRFARPDDYPRIRALIRDGFPYEAPKKERALEELPRESWYDPSHLIVGEEDGKLACMMCLRPGELFCGRVSFTGVHVGTVCTRSELRGKGIGSAMLAHAAGVIEGWGAEVSYLHTEPKRWGFYTRNGYRKAVLTEGKLTVRRLASPGGGPPLREARPSDAPDLDRIHREHFSGLSGAWTRDINFWERRIRRKEKLWLAQAPRLLIAGDEVAVAYIAFTDEAVLELASLHGEREAARALAARAFEETGKGTLAFHLSPKDPFWTLLLPRADGRKVSEQIVFIRAHDTEAVRAKADAGRVPSPLDASGLAALLLNGRSLDGLVEEGVVAPEEAPGLRKLFPDTGAVRPLMDGY